MRYASFDLHADCLPAWNQIPPKCDWSILGLQNQNASHTKILPLGYRFYIHMQISVYICHYFCRFLVKTKVLDKINVYLVKALNEKMGSPQLLQFILRLTWISAPNLMAIHPIAVKIFTIKNHKSQPRRASKGKVSGPPKWGGFILWRPLMSGHDFPAIHPIIDISVWTKEWTVSASMAKNAPALSMLGLQITINFIIH